MERVLRNTAATLSVTFYSDETSVDADGAVTVTVVADDGTTIASNAATTKGALNSGIYSYTLPAQSDLNRLTLTWTGLFSTVSQSLVTRAEVVGGRIFTYGEARAADTVLANTTKYPTAMLERVRTEVEDEFESIAHRAFIPRYGETRLLGNGTDTIRLNHADIRSVRSASIDGTALTAGELADLYVEDHGILVRLDGGKWTADKPVVVRYEYGLGYATPDLKAAALMRCRSRITTNNSGIPDRATTFDSAEGGTYQLATPGRAGWETGIPEVDAVVKRYSLKGPGVF
jgi:hypothetical protein